MSHPEWLDGAFSALEALEKATENLSRVRAHVSRVGQGEKRRIHIKEDPILHAVFDLGRQAWRKHLRDPAFAKCIGHWLDLLLTQCEYYRLASNDSAEVESLSRAFRRTVLLGSQDLRFFEVASQKGLLRSDVLPPPSLVRTDFRMKKASSHKIKDHLLWAARIKSGILGMRRRPMGDSELFSADIDKTEPYFEGDEIRLRKPKEEIEIPDPTDGRRGIRLSGATATAIQASSAFTMMASAETLIKPAAYELLRFLGRLREAGSLSNLETSEIRFLLIASVELLHGIPALDCAELGVNGNGNALGYISGSQLVLNLASGIYPAAREAWKPKILSLPLASECEELSTLLTAKFPAARLLGQCRPHGENFADSYRRQFKIFLRQVMPGYRGTATSVGKVWVKTALALDIASPIVGMLRGNPLPGERGQSAYIDVTLDELVLRLQAIQGEIRKKAGTFVD